MERDRVLVIDDDPDLRELVAVYLADWGFVCVEAAECAEALPLLERERGRLRAVLLDYFMPGLPPRACAREIASRLDPGVPIILTSAAVDIAERAADLQLARFLAKPFDMAELQDLLACAS